jgi:hypothetical protein
MMLLERHEEPNALTSPDSTSIRRTLAEAKSPEIA